MRLLRTNDLEFEEFDHDIPSYAILSHRWEKGEVTITDMLNGNAKKCSGYKKLKAFCDLAYKRGFDYAWLDTCCINKDSSAEMTETINSMFSWYRDSAECYAYLTDVRCTQLTSRRELSEFAASSWFTRGWTLQELIAPTKVRFYNRYWDFLGERSDMGNTLAAITRIDAEVLYGRRSFASYPVAQRMSWAARRRTTRVEDMAYSLLGLFDVYMPMLYGEGPRAFARLQEEIIKQSDDHTLFAWQDNLYAKSIFAPSPVCFSGLTNLERIFPSNDTSQGFTLVNAGLSIQLNLIPWAMNTYLAPLHCKPPTLRQNHVSSPHNRSYNRVCIFLQQTSHDNHFVRIAVDGSDLKVLDGDQVARMRHAHGIEGRQILIRRLDLSSMIKPAPPSYYGFGFSFNHERLFDSGARPSPSDVLTYHAWRPEKPILSIRHGMHHAAGLFRLSGISTGHYMYLGFDRDFSPLCLITSQGPQAPHFARLPTDLGQVSVEDALPLLDLNWLRNQVVYGHASGETLLAFRGHRNRKSSVACRSISLSISFEWSFSELAGKYLWVVRFDRLHLLEAPQERRNSRVGTPDSRTSNGVFGGPVQPVSTSQPPRLTTRNSFLYDEDPDVHWEIDDAPSVTSSRHGLNSLRQPLPYRRRSGS